MAKPDGGPAFPQDEFGGVKGMSLRDYFAGQALTRATSNGWPAKEIASWAYEIADAMLAEREKGQ